MTMSSMTFELNLNDDAVEYERGGGHKYTLGGNRCVFFHFRLYEYFLNETFFHKINN